MSEEDEISSKRAKGPLDVSRRALLIGAGSTAALLGLGALRYAGHNPLVRPPGGQDEARLVSACIRCEKCYEACPRGIIVPAHIEDGLLGMRSPALKFDADFCDYCADENGGEPLCVKVCPTGASYRTDEGVDVRVHPTMLPLSHQLATVDGVYNAIYVTGDAVGETMFFGEGAGAGPAASAVMGDVLEVARHVTLGIGPLVGCTCTDELPIVPMDDLKTKYYIRFKVADRSGVLAAMAGVFAKHNVSVYSVVQRGKKEGGQVDLVYVTHTAREKSVRDVLAEIAELDDVLRDEPSVIRVEE